MNLLDTVGTDFWWKSTAQELLPANHTYSPSDNIEKCEVPYLLFFLQGQF